MNFLVTFGKTSIKFSVIQVMVISKEVGKKATGLFSTKLKEVRRALLTEKTPPKQTKQNKTNPFKVIKSFETKINQNYIKRKVWRRKGTSHAVKHTRSSVKHGGANAMSWSCMTAIRTRSLVFVNPDKSSRMTSEVLRPILC